MELISVIVPVYKVESYLDRCVQSIVDQTYQNLEIILVDDGSPDNCPSMCDAWAAKDQRIKVIHKENGGLSDARNAGMAAASGDLVGFVDSDDRIRADMYQLLRENMQKNHSDIAACGVKMVWEDGTPERMLTGEGQIVLDTQEAMRAVIEESRLKQPVWYKLYKTELIRDIPFPVGKYHEDVFWTYQAVSRANRVSVFDEPCYEYLQRSNSIMGQNFSVKRLDALEAKKERLRFVQERFPALYTVATCDLWFSCIYMMQNLMRHGTSRDQKNGAAIIRSVLRRTPIHISRDMKLSVKQLVWLTMAKCALGLTCRLRNLLGIGV